MQACTNPRQMGDILIKYYHQLFDIHLHVDMCLAGMARFSQQRQSWTRQPTNVKVSKVINSSVVIYKGCMMYLTVQLKSSSSTGTYRLIFRLVGASCFQIMFTKYHRTVFACCVKCHAYLYPSAIGGSPHRVLQCCTDSICIIQDLSLYF